MEDKNKQEAATAPALQVEAQPASDRMRELECVIADLTAECKELRAARPAPEVEVSESVASNEFLGKLLAWINVRHDRTKDEAAYNAIIDHIHEWHAALAARQPVAAVEVGDSIDTPAFRNMLATWSAHNEDWRIRHASESMDHIIDHIHVWHTCKVLPFEAKIEKLERDCCNWDLTCSTQALEIDYLKEQARTPAPASDSAVDVPVEHYADHYYDPLHLLEYLHSNIGWQGTVGLHIQVNDGLLARFMAVFKRDRAARQSPAAPAEVKNASRSSRDGIETKWLIERKAARTKDAMWWKGGGSFADLRSDIGWTSNADEAIKFDDAPSATTGMDKQLIIDGFRTSKSREYIIEEITITEHMWLAPAAPVGSIEPTDEQLMRLAGDMKQRNAGVWPGDVAFARACIDLAMKGQTP